VDDVREVTSEMHSSEKIIGRWLKSSGNRPRILLQTKVTTNFTRQHIQEAIDASLERLQTDWIDLYLFHSFDAKTPLEEGLEALTRAVEQGKIRVAGCSNFSAPQLRESLAISSSRGLQRLEEAQPPYSLVQRQIESELLPLCAQEQIGVIAYSPLGAGFLSGKYERSSIRRVPVSTSSRAIPTLTLRSRNLRLLSDCVRRAQRRAIRWFVWPWAGC